MTDKDIQEAVKAFKQKTRDIKSQRALAEAELEFWSSVKHYAVNASGKRIEQRFWWTKNVGTTGSEHRYRLLQAPKHMADPLWIALDEKKIRSPNAAYILLVKARKENRSIEDVLSEHYQENGDTPAEHHTTFRDVRNVVVDCFRPLVAAFDEYMRNDILRTLSVDVDVVMEICRARIYAAANSSQERIRRKPYIAACKELSVTPPKPGQKLSVEELKRAKQNFRKTARAYHPDLNGGSHRYRDALERLMWAMNVLETFSKESLYADEAEAEASGNGAPEG